MQNLPSKFTPSQQVKKIRDFKEQKSVFRVFQKIRHCTLPWASLVQPPLSIPLRLNFPRGLPDQTSAHGPIFHICAMCLLHTSFLIQLSYQQNVIAPTVTGKT